MRLSTRINVKVVIIEDAQWLDKSSWVLLKELASAKIERLLIVVVTRPMQESDSNLIYQSILEMNNTR